MISRNEEHPSRLPRLLIRYAELAEVLSVSKRTLNRMRTTGDLIRPVRVGKSLRWRLADVEEWIAQGCPRPE